MAALNDEVMVGDLIYRAEDNGTMVSATVTKVHRSAIRAMLIGPREGTRFPLRLIASTDFGGWCSSEWKAWWSFKKKLENQVENHRRQLAGAEERLELWMGREKMYPATEEEREEVE